MSSERAATLTCAAMVWFMAIGVLGHDIYQGVLGDLRLFILVVVACAFTFAGLRMKP